MAKSLLQSIQSDLQRPHHFAAERVGFLFSKFTKTESTALILACRYLPVADEDYILDRRVGARINAHSIRCAMQESLNTGQGIFHLHLHGHYGRPGFSATDERTNRALRACLKIHNSRGITPIGGFESVS